MAEEDVHPYLPAGYNSWEDNGDEVNGAGVNEPLWPVLFNTFEPLTPLILTDAMMEVFEDCPDYVVPAECDVITIPAERSTIVITR